MTNQFDGVSFLIENNKGKGKRSSLK